MDILLILIVIFCLLLSATAIVSIALRVPYVPTKKYVIDKIFKTLKFKKGINFYDLGCGDGRMLLEAEKRTKANVFGYEIAPIVYLMAMFNKLLYRSKAKIYFKNFFNQTLENADVIFCYLMPFQLKKLAQKIKKECKRGTLIVSNTFKIEGLKPQKVIEKNPVEHTPNLYFYKI